MLQNYFKTTLRNIKRHLGYSILNIAGLSIGLASSIFIFLWVADELKYDAFHTHHNTLFKVFHNSFYTNGSIETYGTTPAPLAETIKAEIPEVEYAVRTDWGSELLFEYNEASFLEHGLWADSAFFSMFTFPITKGDIQNPIGVNGVAISEKVAAKYFKGEDPIGKILKVGERYDMKVTAVFKDVPRNSSLQFDFVMPFETYLKERDWMKGWGNSSIQTFVKLYETASVPSVNKKMDALIKKHCKECLVSPILHPYQDIYLYTNFKDGKPNGGRIEYVQAFSIVAIFILIIACINFMNLATARSATRSREVGVRKVIGAQRKGIIVQFIGESIFISFVSMLVAITLVQVTIPYFNLLVNKSVSLDLSNLYVILSLLSIVIITGILAGSYPAFFLSSFKPVTVLKGNVQSVGTGATLRKSLVVVQFAIAVVLISGSIIVNEQIQFIKNKDLGFDRANVITMGIRGNLEKNINAFKTEALKHHGVLSISTAGHNPFDVQNTTTDPVWPGKKENENIPFKIIISDADFIPTLGMNLIQGRNFSIENKIDTANYIVNEAAVQAMNLKNPIGTPYEMWFGKGQIIGVVKDFHNQSFKGSIEPLVFMYYPLNAWRIFIKLDAKNTEESLAHLKKVYEKFDDVYPFEYTFLDQEFEDQYKAETTTGKLSVCFMVVAILISCLGLFGLASFTAERRTKEIGVRKVLGASVPQLISMLCIDFTKLVFIALLLGTPIAFYLMNSFLDQYIYHTDLTVSIFVITGVAILMIALITVIFQSAKAAMSNPVNSLRNE